MLLTLSTASAQMMHIHTSDGETASFNLADIDSMTFSEGDDEAPQPGEERVFELAEGVEIIMCWIPAGSFMMGAQEDEQGALEREYPLHRVTFENGFWMGKYELTQLQWEAVMGNNPSHDFGVGDNYPVYNVSWEDIQNFEAELNDAYHLPSESEWEYSCRAGATTRFYWGDDPDNTEIDDYAVYQDNDPGITAVVGTKLPNAWGLHDTSGNLFEWCEDSWHNNYEDAPDDGSAWLENPVGENRIYRGGCWLVSPSDCRPAFRYLGEPATRGSILGFRLVRDVD